MPAKTSKQQKLFALVHLYHQGKIPADKVSSKIKKIAKHITPEKAREFASTKDLSEVFNSVGYINDTLDEIIENQTPDYVKGQLIDNYTASLIKTVLNHLNEDNKKIFVSKNINEMVALAYKMVTH